MDSPHAAHDLTEHHGKIHQIEQTGEKHHTHDHKIQIILHGQCSPEVEQAAQRQGKKDSAFNQCHKQAVGISLTFGAAFPERIVFLYRVCIVPIALSGHIVGFHYGHPVDELHDRRVQLFQQAMIGRHLFPGNRHCHTLNNKPQHHRHQQAQSHGDIDREQVNEYNHRRAYCRGHVRNLMSQKSLNPFHIFNDDFFDLTRSMVGEESQIHFCNVPADLRAHVV